jgi:hypothetical protein
MTGLRAIIASHPSIGALACRVGAHDWQIDTPTDRHVFMHRRHCLRCGLRQVRGVHPDAEWQDIDEKDAA